MKQTLTYIILLFSSLSFAQNATLKGRIYDKEDKAIVGATIQLKNSDTFATSNDFGYYRMTVPAGKILDIYVQYFTKSEHKSVAPLDPGTEYRLDFTIDFVYTFNQVDAVGRRGREVPSVIEIEPRMVEKFPTTSGFEQILKVIAIGVGTAGGELSSGYNVRGGNFDENLVYINDIEVYRPFLVRSGQQEGLSVINSDLVENLSFSAGGFQAKYGDKLSSVLDIKYREPDTVRATAQVSLLGANIHFEGRNNNERFTYLFGARYRSNQYLLGTLDVQGDYKPRFYDIQSLLSYRIRTDLSLSWLSTLSQNRYLIIPQSRSTSFGNINTALNLNIAFGGKELMQYSTFLNGLSLDYTPDLTSEYKFIISSYNTTEREHFTVEGAYRLNELETNLGSDNFAGIRRNIGFGYFIDHARNDLEAYVFNASHKAKKKWSLGYLHWGFGYQFESIRDILKEWRYNDSSGYNIGTVAGANNKEEIILNEFMKADNTLKSQRYHAYIQNSQLISSAHATRINYGLRSNYWTYNEENVISPRFQFSFEPNKKFNDSLHYRGLSLAEADSLKKRDWLIKMAVGYYYQPPFYRELRDLQGVLNPEIRAQQSIHFVLGADLNFKAWDRPFKFISEIYYKKLDQMVPYVVDNVRIRYLAENSSEGYAGGIDARVNGEFIAGLESWFNFSYLYTRERIEYTDDQGVNKISEWLRRPTDQRVNFSILFQDELPRNPSYKMHLNLVYGSNVPFYFNAEDRFRQGFRIPAYRRVDIGFSKLLFDVNSITKPEKWQWAESLWMSLEIFNLLQFNNTISYILVKDFSNSVYGVPNYLTGRRLNIRFVLKM